jgi:protein-S-isoprenylcysteine O-methyltransferase Ste14
MKHLNQYKSAYFMVFVTLFFLYITFKFLSNPMEITVMLFVVLACLALTIVLFLACRDIRAVSIEEQEYDHGDLTQYKDY